MDQIRVLPDNVANQIAAGEVVGRPASVVKELMENAVDAGSTSVTVSFKDGGKALVMVADNGCGMSENDARMAFERHATSKISSADDLFRLRSFGFRGEALPSIASVSETELLTRRSESELGTRIVINGGSFAGQDYAQVPEGTQFMVRNLFYNTPARRRFLKDPAVEARHIVTEFQRVALCYPEVAFSLYNNDALVYQLPVANLRQRIVGVHGKSISGNLLEVMADTSIVKLEGFVGQPGSSKKTNKEQYFFVNGRYFKSPYFHKAVMQAYDKLLAPDTQPSYFLYLTIDTDKVDVNVHPQKTEVKFDDEQAMWQIFNAAVRESLGRYGVVPMMDFEIDGSLDIPVYKEGLPYKMPDTGVNPHFNPFEVSEKRYSYVDAFTAGSAADIGKVEDGEGRYSVEASSGYDTVDSSVMEFISGEDYDAVQGILEIESTGPSVQNVVRLSERLCVMTFNGMLVVADIPRMRYRVLFERFMMMARSSSTASQQLLFPQTAELSAEDRYILAEMSEELSSLGFDITFGNDNSIEICGLPPGLSPAAAGESLSEIASHVREAGEMPHEKISEEMAVIMSRRIALYSGEHVPDEALMALAAELMGCGNFSFTPSGQSIITAITVKELEQRLK